MTDDFHPKAKDHAIAERLESLDTHVPTLRSGNYKVEVDQRALSRGDGAPPLVASSEHLLIHPLRITNTSGLPNGGAGTLFVAKISGVRHFRGFSKSNQLVIDDAVDAQEGGDLSDDWDGLMGKVDALVTDAPNDDPSLLKEVLQVLGVRISEKRSFSIMGERFALNPTDVVQVFPPAGSRGDHANVLPHVMLKRSTLPWERVPVAEKTVKTGDIPDREIVTALPWMAILVLDDSSDCPAPKPRSIKLGEISKTDAPQGKSVAGTLYNDPEVHFVHPDWVEAEGGETADQTLQVIDLRWDQLKPILPKPSDISHLAHVRKRVVPGEKSENAHAVVVANRLPSKTSDTLAVLVSLEHRYVDGAFWPDVDRSRPENANAPAIADDAMIRLVVLKSWRFGCLNNKSFMVTNASLNSFEKKQTPAIKAFFKGDGKTLLGREIVKEEPFRDALSGLKATDDVDLVVANSLYKKLSFKSLLMELDKDVLRLPEQAVPLAQDHPARPFLEGGNVALPHRLRTGGQGASWYHGPLSASALGDEDLPDHALASDHLLRTDSTLGMLDVSYAAAWEIGRLMMLSSKTVALDLFKWKRAHARRLKDGLRAPHLPFSLAPAGMDLPKTVRNWVFNTALAKGIPFSYLVPDPNMLPAESIRFFQIDETWIKAMLDGALSIGRLNESDMKHDAKVHEEHGLPLDLAECPNTEKTWPSEGASGVLIRSDLIASWPHLQVDAVAFLTPDIFEIDGGSKEQVKKQLSVNGKLLQGGYDCLNELALGLPDMAQCYSYVTKQDDENNPVGWAVLDSKDRLLCKVDDFKADPKRLQVTLANLRVERLSSNTLIAMFHGHYDAVDVHQKPEALHFGISMPDPVTPMYHKVCRDPLTGAERPDAILKSIPWRGDDEQSRVIEIDRLAQRLSKKVNAATALSPGQFALQMIEGVERVRFEIGTPQT